MKRISTALVLLFTICTPLLAQETKTNEVPRVAAADAKDHVGSEAIVTGTVADIYKTDSRILLNFDKPYPNQTFTAVVFSSNTNLFTSSDLTNAKGKKVEIIGKIVLYRDRPEIVLTPTNRFTIVGEADTKK